MAAPFFREEAELQVRCTEDIEQSLSTLQGTITEMVNSADKLHRTVTTMTEHAEGVRQELATLRTTIEQANNKQGELNATLVRLNRILTVATIVGAVATLGATIIAVINFFKR